MNTYWWIKHLYKNIKRTNTYEHIILNTFSFLKPLLCIQNTEVFRLLFLLSLALFHFKHCFSAGELGLRRTKSQESLMEVCNDSDRHIDP